MLLEGKGEVDGGTIPLIWGGVVRMVEVAALLYQKSVEVGRKD